MIHQDLLLSKGSGVCRCVEQRSEYSASLYFQSRTRRKLVVSDLCFQISDSKPFLNQKFLWDDTNECQVCSQTVLTFIEFLRRKTGIEKMSFVTVSLATKLQLHEAIDTFSRFHLDTR